MKKMNQNMLKLTERIVRVTVEKERQARLPICPTLLHQPKRPVVE